MPGKRVPDQKIITRINNGETNNFIFKQTGVGVPRIKKIRERIAQPKTTPPPLSPPPTSRPPIKHTPKKDIWDTPKPIPATIPTYFYFVADQWLRIRGPRAGKNPKGSEGMIASQILADKGFLAWRAMQTKRDFIQELKSVAGKKPSEIQEAT